MEYYSQLIVLSQTPVSATAPVSTLSLLHATSVAYFWRKEQRANIPLLQGFVSFVLLCFGGSTVVSILLNTYPGWLVNGDSVLPLYFAVFAGMFFTPGDRLFNALFRIKPVLEPLLTISEAVSRFNTVAWALDNVAKNEALRHSTTAYIVCGLLAASGGGLLSGLLSLRAVAWKLGTPPILAAPPTPVLSTWAVVAGYILALNDSRLPMRIDAGSKKNAGSLALVIALLVCYYAAQKAASSSLKAPPRKATKATTASTSGPVTRSKKTQ